MGKIGHGYGSEWHLLRYLGRHRHQFNRALEEVTGGQVVDWLDFPFGDPGHFYLGEHKGLDFLFDDKACELKQEWNRFWPQTGNAMNWDAVGWLRNGDRMELLLVEAKCHAGELESHCGAKSSGGLCLINKSLNEAKNAFGAPQDADWTAPYYQYCNRLAVLHFLKAHCIPARILFVYFTGESMSGRDCPASKAEWSQILERLYDHIEVPWAVQEQRGVHKVFLPVCP